jgi:membrane protein
VNPIAFARRSVSRLRDIELARTAGALSFTTLLAIVPLLTVAVALVTRFPIFSESLDALESFVLTHLLPESPAAAVHTYVTEFVDQAARLTGVSLVLILLTAMLALATVEREINMIWGVRRGRPLIRRLPFYVLCLTAGPILIGASISLTTWLVAESLSVIPLRKPLHEDVLHTLPFLFSAVGLTLLYKVVPARHVPLTVAVAGAVPTALALEIAKHAFAWYLKQVPTYKFIYGTLAALPAFLVWIYVGWVIVLAGAAMCAVIGGGGERRDQRD